MPDMTKDFFADTDAGKLALKKMSRHKGLPENFRLYSMGWMEELQENFENIIIKGCEFRIAKRGRNAGKLSIRVKGTERTAVIHKSELLGNSEK